MPQKPYCEYEKFMFWAKKWAKSETKSVYFFTKYSIFIVDVKSGRFMYQSGRVGDEAKKCNSTLRLKALLFLIGIAAFPGWMLVLLILTPGCCVISWNWTRTRQICWSYPLLIDLILSYLPLLYGRNDILLISSS